MKAKKIAVVYFSGTHVTKAYAEVIGKEVNRLGGTPELIDVTAFSARTDPFPALPFDGFFFGAPVFADFPPRVLSDWLPGLAGAGKPCATFAVYGGRTPGYAHYRLYDLLGKAGFRVRLAAEFLGRHTFNLIGWKLMPGRPDERDFAVARRFAALALQRFDPRNREAFSLQRPLGYDSALKAHRDPPLVSERRWAQPVRMGDCSMCGLCESECPSRAMDARSGESDPAKCIECLHCLYICPDQALKVDDRLGRFFPGFLKEHGLTEDVLNHKESRIIAAPGNTEA
jgi:ferredoxin